MQHIPIRDVKGFHKHVDTLLPDQKKFVDLLNNWFENPRPLIVKVAGGPGVGKTYTVTKTLNFVKGVLKMAHSARVAERIGGRTIHSCLKLAWGKDTVFQQLEENLQKEEGNLNYIETCTESSKVLLEEFNKNISTRILVIDEISTIQFWFLHRILEHFWEKVPNMLAVMMGDPFQIGPVRSPYSLFEVDYPNVEMMTVNLNKSKRFAPTYNVIIENLKNLLQDEEGFREYVNQMFPMVQDINETVLEKCERAIVCTNLSVQHYNEYYLDRMKDKKEYRMYIMNENGSLNLDDCMFFKKKCLVNVTENGCSIVQKGENPVNNGTTLIFEGYDKKKDCAECTRLSGAGPVSIRRSIFTHKIPIVVGFANTIHKCQGETIDDKGILFNFDQCSDLRLIYTGLSRVRSMDQIVAVKL